MTARNESGDLEGSSPHTRGALALLLHHAAEVGIIPAYAGSTDKADRVPALRRDHPRIRGEHMTARNESGDLEGSSPHTRGAPDLHLRSHGEHGIIPAYAGSTARRRCPARASRDHPRIRGEHTVAIDPKDDWEGSSPHTRGAPDGALGAAYSVGIIPAYAGSTASPSGCSRRARDHPRIRGEHSNTINLWQRNMGSSPHTRGAR